MFALFAIAAPLVAALPAPEAHAEHIDVALLAAETALVPGHIAPLGIRLRHAPHWHTYWINPGDSGLPTELVWHLPEGYRAGAIDWPAPQRFTLGDIANFGYAGEVLLPVSIEVPQDAALGTRASLAVEVKWLVCREECIPGKAMLALELPVRAAAEPDARHAAAFAAARAALPRATTWTGAARLVDDRVEATLRGADLPAGELDAFVAQRKVVAAARPRARREGDTLTLAFDRSEYFAAAPAALDLVVRAGARAFAAHVPFVDAASSVPSSSRNRP
jgi:thiol:disulfide interchange protein DsbD